MFQRAFAFFLLLWAGALAAAPGSPGANALTQRPWLETRTPNFRLYSCAATQEVARLALRLEQFRGAYSQLAGAQAVASPPIVVMAFPDQASMRPFLPVYQGKPANLSALFSRGSDQNLIVLALAGPESGSLRAVFHEYAHLLFRHNQPYWPLWLTEGMAEIYSTFAVSGSSRALIGQPIESHLRFLAGKPLLPLEDLLAVTHGSPEYNDRQHQGVFYAESWLLTHYLMLGGNANHQASFRQLTPLLRQGQTPEQAFTNALHTTLPVMDAELRRYLARGKFRPLELTLGAGLQTPRSYTARALTPMEVCYRLGDQLLHIGRLEAAESYFLWARELAPASPLPYEGLGLLAARQHQHAQAVRQFRHAAQLGPMNFLAHYTYAQEKYLLTGHESELHLIEAAEAAEIRGQLQKSLALMPDFGPAHHLLGFLGMVQGADLAGAERHVRRAIQLEPENLAYVLTLAQIQLARSDPAAARRTLEPLCLRYVTPEIRSHAEDMLKAISLGAD